MGYFKQDMIENFEDRWKEDRRCQLEERLQCLEERLIELNDLAGRTENPEEEPETTLNTKEDLAAVLPEHMKNCPDIQKAMEYVEIELNSLRQGRKQALFTVSKEGSDCDCRKHFSMYLDFGQAV